MKVKKDLPSMTLSDWAEEFEEKNPGIKAKIEHGSSFLWSNEFIKFLHNTLSKELPSIG